VFYIFIFGLCLFLPLKLQSQVIVEGDQTAEGFDKNIYGLGFSAGPTSGVGISFRNHFPSKLSLQLVTGIIKNKDDVYFSLGGEIQYDLVRGQTTRFYFFPGISYFYQGTDKNEVESPVRFGAGIGGEFKYQEALHISFEGAFTFYNDGSILPLPQASVHYYFY